MRKKLKKISAIILSLALIFSSIQIFSAVTSDKFTVTKSVTVNPSDITSLGVENYISISSSNKATLTNGFTADGGTVTYNTNIGNYYASTGGITKVNEVDLSTDNISVKEWSYTYSLQFKEGSDFGIIYNWDYIVATEASYTALTGNVYIKDNEYSYIRSYVSGSTVWHPVKYSITAAYNSETKSYDVSASSGGTSQVTMAYYWKGAPKFKVSYKDNNDGTHTYSVVATDIYTLADSVYTAAEDTTVVTKVVDDTSAAALDYILLGGGGYIRKGIASYITDISVTYEAETDITTACQEFLASGNDLLNKAYADTLSVNATNAQAIKTDVATVKAAYAALSEDCKSALTANGYTDIEAKLSEILTLCNKAIYGSFTADKTVTVTPETITSLETTDYIQFYNNSSVLTNSLFSASGNVIKYINSQQHAVGIGAITGINGVDLTGDDVAVKEWSYTLTADSSKNSKIGYIKSWNYIRPDAVRAVGMTSSTNLGSDGYSSLYINVLTIKTADIGGTATYDTENASWAYLKTDISSYPYDNNFNYYWLGAPKFKIAYKDNNDGTHTYSVTATDIYTLADSVYTKTDDVVKVTKTVSDDSEAALDFVMLSAGGYVSSSKDITISDINVTYTAKTDITSECISVLEAGDGIITEIAEGTLDVTSANADEVITRVADAQSALSSADASVKSAITSKYEGIESKLIYTGKYADVVKNAVKPELAGINLKEVSSAEGSDMRFVVKYEADANSTYTIKGYGAVVVPSQVRADSDALTVNSKTTEGKEDYFSNVYKEADTVAVNSSNYYYVKVTNSQGKPGTMFDCRPYVVYTDGTDEFTVYADNTITDKGVSNGQASKCVIFGAKALAELIADKLGDSAVLPDGYTAFSEIETILDKIGVEKTTTEEKNAVFAFIYINYDSYKKA